MVALFKDRSPATVIWLFLLSIIVHSHFFIAGTSIAASPPDGLLSVFLIEHLAGINPSLLIVFYHLVVVLQSLQLNYLLNNQRMFSRNTFLPAMVYILLTGAFTAWGNVSPPLIINSLVIWLFGKSVTLYNNPNPKTLLFNLGLLIGISILLYHPSSLLIPVVFLTIIVVRPFTFSELVVFIMGVLSPYYFLAAYLYLTDHLLSIITFLPTLRFNLLNVILTPLFFITLGTLLLILFLGFYHYRLENRKLLIQVRKNWVILLIMLLLLLAVPFINYNAGFTSLLLWIVPAASFMAKGFLGPKKNILPGLMFWALLAIAIIANWQIFK